MQSCFLKIDTINFLTIRSKNFHIDRFEALIYHQRFRRSFIELQMSHRNEKKEAKQEERGDDDEEEKKKKKKKLRTTGNQEERGKKRIVS